MHIATGSAGVETFYGGARLHPTAVGYPAEITAAYTSTLGYTVKQLTLLSLAPGNHAYGQPYREYVVALDGNTELDVGTRGFIYPTDNGNRWVFVAHPAGAGKGSPNITSSADDVSSDSATQFQMESGDTGEATPAQFQMQVSESGGGAGVAQFTFVTILDGVTGTPFQFQASGGNIVATSTSYWTFSGNNTYSGTSTFSGTANYTGTVNLSNATVTFPPAISAWTKYTRAYTDYSTGATTNTLNLVTLSARQRLGRIMVKHSASFTGGGATAVTHNVGRTGVTGEYITGQDVFQATSDTILTSRDVFVDTFFSNHAGWTITVTLTSDVNLNTLTTGSLDIWLETFTLPAS